MRGLLTLFSPSRDVPSSATGATRPVALPLPQRLKHTVALTFSALLSPYLVIPMGTVGIVATQPSSRRQLVLWVALAVFFSTMVPALYVAWGVLTKRITDIHVAEREQRGAPFILAIASSALGALVLWLVGAPSQVWALGVVTACNGIVMLLITSRWKISIHVAVLSATVLMAITTIPEVNPWPLLVLIPLLMWARHSRGRHSLWQGIAGCAVACALTWGIMQAIYEVMH